MKKRLMCVFLLLFCRYVVLCGMYNNLTDEEIVFKGFCQGLSVDKNALLAYVESRDNNVNRIFVDDCSHSCLQRACMANEQTVVELLLQRGDVCIDYKDNEGWTALMWACKQGCVEIVRNLLKHGADYNLRAQDLSTALYIACNHKRDAVVEVLLSQDGIDANVQSRFGDTPLIRAAKKSLSVLNILLDSGKVDVHKTDDKRQTFFYFAVLGGCVDNINKLSFFCRFSPEEKINFLYQQLCFLVEMNKASADFQDHSLEGKKALDSFITFCINSGAYLNQRNEEGKRIMDIAHDKYRQSKRQISEYQVGIRTYNCIVKEVVYHSFLVHTPVIADHEIFYVLQKNGIMNDVISSIFKNYYTATIDRDIALNRDENYYRYTCPWSVESKKRFKRNILEKKLQTLRICAGQKK